MAPSRPESPARRRTGARAFAAAAVALAAAAATPPAAAQSIYQCVDEQGRRLTSDRPIAACVGREQRVLNRDGSLQRIIQPSLTADERAAREAAERSATLRRAALQDAIRRDRNLVARFPDEAAHGKARETALEPMRLAMKHSQARLVEIAGERKPLAQESEFYKGRSLPAKLRQQLDANDALAEAQRTAVRAQETEIARVNAMYDRELERLRRLWAGAPYGSLPPDPPPAPLPSPATAAATPAQRIVPTGAEPPARP